MKLDTQLVLRTRGGRDVELRAAGPFARALALAVDEPIRWLLVAGCAGTLARNDALDAFHIAMVLLLVYGGYGSLFEVLRGGQTPGKRLLGIAAVTSDGSRISWRGALLRNVLLLVDVLPCLYLLGAFTITASKQFRRIGDRIAGTRVIYLGVAPVAASPPATAAVLQQAARLDVAVRGRLGFEAADLGCLLVARWPAMLFGSWLMTALPVFLLATAVFGGVSGIVGVLLWWCKPLYERLPLWLVSQRIRGGAPTIGAALSQWRSVYGDLAALLTYRRLTPTRSFDAPVAVLENLKGTRRARRVVQLRRGAAAEAAWLTIIGVHIESFIAICATSAWVWFIAPANLDLQGWLTFLIGGEVAWASNVCYFVSIASFGPIYAACGFTLYLNQRTLLEGWARNAV